MMLDEQKLSIKAELTKMYLLEPLDLRNSAVIPLLLFLSPKAMGDLCRFAKTRNGFPLHDFCMLYIWHCHNLTSVSAQAKIFHC